MGGGGGGSGGMVVMVGVVCECVSVCLYVCACLYQVIFLHGKPEATENYHTA